jgi:DNA uptake protein ComE-like DNA-binding protein
MHNVNKNRANVQELTRKRHRSSGEDTPFPGVDETAASAQSIDLNHATCDQLAEIDGIETELARSIVEHRTFNGHFLAWDDVRRVPGMDDEHVEALQHAVRIGGPLTDHH